MLVTEKMKAGKFSDAQQAVIDYICKEDVNIANMTIQEIAKACYTSNATLIRLAHKLGYSGWDSFKENLLEEQKYLSSHFPDIDANIPFSRQDSIASILNKVAQLKAAAIEDTAELISPAHIRKAADLIDQAGMVIILGSHNTLMLGDSFALKLGRIGKRAQCYSSDSELRYNHELESPDVVVVAISYSGETVDTLRNVNTAYLASTPIIAITSIGDSTLSDLANVVLPICTREKMYSKISWYTTESAIDYVLDVLYSVLFWKHYDQNLNLRIQTARTIESHRQAASSVIAEEETK